MEDLVHLLEVEASLLLKQVDVVLIREGLVTDSFKYCLAFSILCKRIEKRSVFYNVKYETNCLITFEFMD